MALFSANLVLSGFDKGNKNDTPPNVHGANSCVAYWSRAPQDVCLTQYIAPKWLTPWLIIITKKVVCFLEASGFVKKSFGWSYGAVNTRVMQTAFSWIFTPSETASLCTFTPTLDQLTP
jgi:hypothetical protein